MAKAAERAGNGGWGYGGVWLDSVLAALPTTKPKKMRRHLDHQSVSCKVKSIGMPNGM